MPLPEEEQDSHFAERREKARVYSVFGLQAPLVNKRRMSRLGMLSCSQEGAETVLTLLWRRFRTLINVSPRWSRVCRTAVAPSH